MISLDPENLIKTKLKSQNKSNLNINYTKYEKPKHNHSLATKEPSHFSNNNSQSEQYLSPNYAIKKSEEQSPSFFMSSGSSTPCSLTPVSEISKYEENSNDKSPESSTGKESSEKNKEINLIKAWLEESSERFIRNKIAKSDLKQLSPKYKQFKCSKKQIILKYYPGKSIQFQSLKHHSNENIHNMSHNEYDSSNFQNVKKSYSFAPSPNLLPDKINPKDLTVQKPENFNFKPPLNRYPYYKNCSSLNSPQLPNSPYMEESITFQNNNVISPQSPNVPILPSMSLSQIEESDEGLSLDILPELSPYPNVSQNLSENILISKTTEKLPYSPYPKHDKSPNSPSVYCNSVLPHSLTTSISPKIKSNTSPPYNNNFQKFSSIYDKSSMLQKYSETMISPFNLLQQNQPRYNTSSQVSQNIVNQSTQSYHQNVVRYLPNVFVHHGYREYDENNFQNYNKGQIPSSNIKYKINFCNNTRYRPY